MVKGSGNDRGKHGLIDKEMDAKDTFLHVEKKMPTLLRIGHGAGGGGSASLGGNIRRHERAKDNADERQHLLLDKLKIPLEYVCTKLLLL